MKIILFVLKLYLKFFKELLDANYLKYNIYLIQKKNIRIHFHEKKILLNVFIVTFLYNELQIFPQEIFQREVSLNLFNKWVVFSILFSTVTN